jgi:putative nucleotidyltransferase with HDIG domain
VAGPWRLVLFGLLFALVLQAILLFQFLPSRYALNEGEVSPYDVKSPAKITFVSQSRTQQEREQAAAAVADVYRPIPNADAQAVARASGVLDAVSRARAEGTSGVQRITRLTQVPGATISEALASSIVSLDDAQWQDTSAAILRSVDQAMRARITPAGLDQARAIVPAQVDPSLDDREMTIAVSLVREFLTPTVEVDSEGTDAARKAAADAVPPVQVTIEKGEMILRSGDIVTAGDLEKLQAAGLRNPSIRWNDIAATGLVGLAISVLLCVYLYVFQPSLAGNPRRLALLGLLLLAPILAAKLTIPGRPLYAYLFPLAAAPMLLTMLLGVDVSLIATVIQAIGLGLVAGGDLELVVAGVVAGGLGALSVHRLERVNALSLATLAVAAGDFAVVVSFQVSTGDLDAERLALDAFLALVSGGMSAALTLGMVSFLGNAFGIATTMNLLELAHPSQPVFRRLLTEAPGTYHHSVVVANLAERAAAAIGADTLLVRIGGYYHDIGKLGRPYAFVENQLNGENIHDQLDPYTSARIILGHVTDGLQLAAKHGIPTRVRDIIAQHHGTMLVQYFHRRACENAGAPVAEAPFRYAGPRPQSREAAIIMLADGVEAAVRASRDHSAEAIARVVEGIFQERIAGGQLDECDLTLADLQRVKAAFLSVLQSIFHPRIEYPPAEAPSGPREIVGAMAGPVGSGSRP